MAVEKLEAKVKVQMSGSLFDQVVDSIAYDVQRMTGEDLRRRSDLWVVAKRGRGCTLTAMVSEDAARYIASYLESRVGCSVWFDEGRGAARRSEEEGAKIARSISGQL